MNRIKLPQDGQVIDTDSIIGAYWQDDPATRLIVRLEGMKDGLLFTGSDARALYAWLEANSTAIGEDGREATNDEIELTSNQVKVLNLLQLEGRQTSLQIFAKIPSLKADSEFYEMTELYDDVIRFYDENAKTYYDIGARGIVYLQRGR